MNSRSKEAPNNLAGYQGKIKSNQQLFQQQNPRSEKQYSVHQTNQVSSPFKPAKKKADMHAPQNMGYNQPQQKSNNKLLTGH